MKVQLQVTGGTKAAVNFDRVCRKRGQEILPKRMIKKQQMRCNSQRDELHDFARSRPAQTSNFETDSKLCGAASRLGSTRTQRAS